MRSLLLKREIGWGGWLNLLPACADVCRLSTGIPVDELGLSLGEIFEFQFPSYCDVGRAVPAVGCIVVDEI